MWRNNPSPASIIGRREIEPLLFKACEALKVYEEATGATGAVLDQSGHVTGEENCAIAIKFCTFCRKYYRESVHGAASAPPQCGESAPRAGENPCDRVHIAAAARARRTGGVYIYMCGLGFMFWTAPLFANGHSPGALVAGGMLGSSKSRTIEKLRGLHPDNPELPEAEQMIREMEEKTRQEIKSLAQILLIAAEQVSRSLDDHRSPATSGAEQGGPASKQLHLVRNQTAPEDPAWPLDRERILLAALRRGDGDAWRKALNELLEYIQNSARYSFDSMRHRVVELTVLLSRAAMSPGKAGWDPYSDIFGASGPVKTETPPEIAEEDSDGAILENNNRSLGRIQEAKTPEELANILRLIAERLSSQIFSFKGVRHASALRKAERFIWDNYTRKISLKEIARASGLSGPYFSSIFKEEMGENLSNYLNRLRVERAMTMLSESDRSLNAIAAACGFEDQSWFSKIFKSFAGVTPGKFREQGQGRFPAPNTKDDDDWAIGPWTGSRFPAKSFAGNSADDGGTENSKETG